MAIPVTAMEPETVLASLTVKEWTDHQPAGRAGQEGGEGRGQGGGHGGCWKVTGQVHCTPLAVGGKENPHGRNCGHDHRPPPRVKEGGQSDQYSETEWNET